MDSAHFNSTMNATFPYTQTAANWTLSAASKLIFTVVTVLLNGGMLMYWTRDKTLQTPFSVYLIFLLGSNILYSIAQYPLLAYLEAWSPMPIGFTLCTLYLYSPLLSGVPEYAHSLITINRIWALTFPHSYKHHHSKKTAIVLCVAAVLFVHVVMLPYYILDRLYYARPEEVGGCWYNAAAMKGLSTTVQLVIFDLPDVIVCVSYPFLWYKESKRRVKRNQIGFSTKTGGPETSVFAGGNPETARTARSRPFVVLTLLTASVFICWTPSLTYFTVLLWSDSTLLAVGYTTGILAQLQTVLDPILFALSLRSFQQAIKKTFCTKKASSATPAGTLLAP